jgi:hypothetical protein
MIRAVAKGAIQLAFGRAPGGPAAYRALTRGRMGTAATHVDKLARVWPGYVALWSRYLQLDGAQLWVHDAGATPFAPIAAYLLTGRGAAITNPHDRILDRYLARARAGALAAAWPTGSVPADRRRTIEGLRWLTSAEEALRSLGTVSLLSTSGSSNPAQIAGEGVRSVDLCHSGGTLEHLAPAALDAFLADMHARLAPGGIASHVFDHRDHLHHADRTLPFLAHLAWPEPAYRALLAHPLGYHSRLSPTDVAARFEAAGFERIAVRRLIYAGTDRRWVDTDADALAGREGLPRARLASRFRAISEADLRTAAAHYLYHKPRAAADRPFRAG